MQLIDIPLWNRAGWLGVAFGMAPQDQTFMALVFTNHDAAEEIFRGFQRAIGGNVDTYEMLRVAIIEGDIPGKEAGYTVHLSTDLDGVDRAMRASGQSPHTPDYVLSRIHRIPAPDSPHLSGFKRDFARHGSYLLLPASFIQGGDDVELAPSLGILKRAVTFKHVTDIGSDDQDRAIFATEFGERAH